MPQASDELRAKMQQYFGDPVDDTGPIKFLLDAGYKEWNGVWYRPSLTHEMTIKEGDCIEFMFQEWDYDFDPTRLAP